MRNGTDRNTSAGPRIALGLVVTVAVIYLAGLAVGRSFTPIGNLSKFGYDFNDFRRAARDLLAGKDPWQEVRFVTPPLSAYVQMPLAGLRPRLARSVFLVVNLACLTLGVLLYRSSLFAARRTPGLNVALVITAVLSYPVFFLLQRGNIDGWVFVLMALGVRLASKGGRILREILAALAFALAMHLKLYPLLILLPMAITRRWRLAGATLAAALAFAGLTPHLWQAYLVQLPERLEIFTLQENGSLVSSLVLLLAVPNHLTAKLPALYDLHVLTAIGAGVYGLLLLASAVLDVSLATRYKPPDFAVLAISYLPFMVIVPRIAYHYELVHLLAAVILIHWLQATMGSNQRACVTWMSIGVVLSQVQAAALYFLTDNLLAYFIPGAGVLLLVVASLLLRLSMAKRSRPGQPHPWSLDIAQVTNIA